MVSVIVSSGGLIVLPNVIGLEEGSAVRGLQRLGLRTESTTRFDLSRPPGTVIRQDPAAGTAVEPESVVHLLVARRFLGEFEREPIPIEPVLPPIIPPRLPLPLPPPGRLPP